MQKLASVFERRTAADVVFEQLHKEIVSLELRPGTKVSEAEVARRFGTSRQPVREAFSRLGNLDLLLVRPQKATTVRGFSLERVAHARFVRLAVELEVITQACMRWETAFTDALQFNLDKQRRVIADGEIEQFHTLICELAGCTEAIEAIADCRQKIDRLCSLSLTAQSETDTLLKDHELLVNALDKGARAEAIAITRQHLSRLDKTIEDIHRNHAEYFE
jgi:DNA-binding GntR family transcriptional regulator